MKMKLAVIGLALSACVFGNDVGLEVESLFKVDGTKDGIQKMGDIVYDGIVGMDPSLPSKARAMELKYAIEKYNLYSLVKMMSSLELKKEEVNSLKTWAKSSKYIHIFKKSVKKTNPNSLYVFTKDIMPKYSKERMIVIQEILKYSREVEVSVGVGILTHDFLKEQKAGRIPASSNKSNGMEEMAILNTMAQSLTIHYAYTLRKKSDAQLVDILAELKNPLVQKYFMIKNKNLVSGLEQSFKKVKKPKKAPQSFRGNEV